MILEEGSVIGDHSVVHEGARVRAQVKVWPGKQIEGGATVGASLIWGAQGRRSLFGRFGVTGLVNVDLTPEFAARLGSYVLNQQHIDWCLCACCFRLKVQHVRCPPVV